MNKWQVNIKIWQVNIKIWEDDIIWQVMAEVHVCHHAVPANREDCRLFDCNRNHGNRNFRLVTEQKTHENNNKLYTFHNIYFIFVGLASFPPLHL